VLGWFGLRFHGGEEWLGSHIGCGILQQGVQPERKVKIKGVDKMLQRPRRYLHRQKEGKFNGEQGDGLTRLYLPQLRPAPCVVPAEAVVREGARKNFLPARKRKAFSTCERQVAKIVQIHQL